AGQPAGNLRVARAAAGAVVRLPYPCGRRLSGATGGSPHARGSGAGPAAAGCRLMGPGRAPGASLAPLQTIGIDEAAEQLCLVHSDAELREALALADQRGWPVQLLGGGSNLVLAGPVSGLTVVMRSRGRRVVRRNGDSALIEAEAGENWHRLVGWS